MFYTEEKNYLILFKCFMGEIEIMYKKFMASANLFMGTQKIDVDTNTAIPKPRADCMLSLAVTKTSCVEPCLHWNNIFSAN